MSQSKPSTYADPGFAGPGPAAGASVLEGWHRMNRMQATAAILPCNGSEAWATAMVAGRPYLTPAELFSASDEVWGGLDAAARQQAFDSHPRIGERKAVTATAQSLRLSQGEQSTMVLDSTAKTALAAANEAYEERFGRIFLICATGKSAAEMLASLEARMNNDPVTEREIAAAEQNKITQLRLRKWLGFAFEVHL